jgi:hypothetical protein
MGSAFIWVMNELERLLLQGAYEEMKAVGDEIRSKASENCVNVF